jgi:hypothetical protein
MIMLAIRLILITNDPLGMPIGPITRARAKKL